MFRESYGKDGLDEERLAELKHEVMDDEWPMFEKMLEEGPPGWWMRLRCRLVSGEERSIGVWAAQHNFYRRINRSADPEWEQRHARERIKKFGSSKNFVERIRFKLRWRQRGFANATPMCFALKANPLFARNTMETAARPQIEMRRRS